MQHLRFSPSLEPLNCATQLFRYRPECNSTRIVFFFLSFFSTRAHLCVTRKEQRFKHQNVLRKTSFETNNEHRTNLRGGAVGQTSASFSFNRVFFFFFSVFSMKSFGNERSHGTAVPRVPSRSQFNTRADTIALIVRITVNMNVVLILINIAADIALRRTYILRLKNFDL